MVRNPRVAPTANHVWRHGVITMRDLHTYVAPERAPTHVTYRGHDVYSMGPPSSGGSTVGEALNILEGYDLSAMPRADALHYFLEASRLSFADRNAYLADPAYYDVPLAGLLSKEYAATRRADHRHRGDLRRAGRSLPVQQGERVAHRAAVGDDDAPDDERPVGQRRLVHVHDRIDRRFRSRRARLRVPAEQRAHGLQLRLDDAPEPGRGRQATAELDEPDDRAPRTASRSWHSALPVGR